MSADLASLLQAMGEGRARPTQGACLAAAERIRELERQLAEVEVGGCSCGAKFYSHDAAQEHECSLDQSAPGGAHG